MGNFFNSKKFILPLVILWAVTLAAVILLVLPGNPISSGFKQVVPVEVQNAQPSGHGPYSYIVPMGTKLLTQNDTFQSPTQLYEDEQALGPGNSQHADIGTKGMGRFSFWKGGSLIFSSSDNSNPRTNGRQYTLVISFRKILFTVGLGILLTITLIFAFLFRKYLKSPRNLFYISLLIVTIAFIIPRLPWFVDYPIPAIYPDTSTYFAPVKQIFLGQIPIFDYRTAGYPMFLTAIFLISPKLMSVVSLQCIITLASALFFIWAVYRAYPQLVILSGFAMVAQVAQPFLSGHDFALLTESLYASFLVISMGFWLLAIKTRRARYFFLFSLTSGLLIIIRPAGVFLFASVFLTVIYLIANRYSWKCIFSLILPIFLLVFSAMAYNFYTKGFWGISTHEPVAMYGITSVFWEPDDDFPAEVNKEILMFREALPTDTKKILETSWDPDKLYWAFLTPAIKATRETPFSELVNPININRTQRYTLANRIAEKAILSHPQMFIKWFWMNFYIFIKDTASWHVFYYSGIRDLYNNLWKDVSGNDPFVMKEYTQFPILKYLPVVDSGANKEITVIPSTLYIINQEFNYLLIILFDNIFWLPVYLFVVISSAIKLVHSKFRDEGAFVVFVFGQSLLMAGVIVALLAGGMSNRYPAPTRFIEYLTVCFSPLLFTYLWKFKESRTAPKQ